LLTFFGIGPTRTPSVSATNRAIVRFQTDLAGSKPPGFIGATSFQIEAVPWLSHLPGYEDWYLLSGTWAMDPLNAFAISGHVQAPHDSVAAMMEQGHGGLYAHAGGESMLAPHYTIHWLTRPRGIQWQPTIEAVRGSCPHAQAWRRQMVLGPAAEFAVEPRQKQRSTCPTAGSVAA
jgi:hypothetical protein